MSRDEFLARANLSPPVLTRLDAMDNVLIDWSSRHNLIARSTIEDRWIRHYLDSAQIGPLLPDAPFQLVDLGSGAGFPGLVIAAMKMDVGADVTLIESVGKKAAFLREAAAQMGLSNVSVRNERIEAISFPKKPGFVTARALARLDKLLGYAHGIGGESAHYIFLKGQDVDNELTEAAKCWDMEVKRHMSMTDPGGAILEIGNVKRARANASKPTDRTTHSGNRQSKGRRR